MAFINLLKSKKEKPTLDIPPPPSIGAKSPAPPLPAIPKIEFPSIEPEEQQEMTPIKEIPKAEDEAEAYAPVKPLFIKANEYKSVINGISEVKEKITDAESILARLIELKNTKDKEFEKWKKTAEDIQRKLVFVDKTLFEGG